MNTLEGNKLIDIFNDNYLLNRGFDVNEMNYHSDWKSLMPVVEKIEELDLFDISINWDSVCVWNWKTNTELFKDETSDTKLERVYNVCLEFIQWYNDQNK